MTDWRTIRIPEDDFEEHRELKEQLGLDWAEYIAGQSPEHKLVDYAHVREIVREETREALEEMAR